MHKKQSRSPPPPQSEQEQKEQLEKPLSRYTCTLDKETSMQARQYGLEHQKSVCSVVAVAVNELVRKPENRSSNDQEAKI